MMKSSFLEPYLSELQGLCMQHDVSSLEVFGSVLRDDFSVDSDIDFLVRFRRDETTNAFHQYFDFKEALTALLGRPVDLVCVDAVQNPYFKEEIDATRQPLYAA